MRLTILLTLALLSSVVRADDWPAAHPRSWHGRGFEYVVEVFPPKSRHNATAKPLAYFYQVSSGDRWNVAAKLVWKGPLVNREAPYEAIVSMGGWLVTFDDWANLGFANAIAIYDPRGKLVKSLKLDDLGIPADIRDRDQSVSSRYWRKGARYAIDDAKKLLQIQLPGAGTVEVSLADGKARYLPKAKAALGGNAEAEVCETSLRFSSITDVMAAKQAQPATPPAKTK